MTRPLLLVVILGALAAAPAVLAQSPDTVGADTLAEQSGDPVNISADSLEVAEDSNTALFTGNVIIVQGDMEMTAPRVQALYGEGGPSDLVEFTASGGRVQMVTEDQTVDGDQANYNFESRVLTFAGNVVVVNPSGTVNADRLVIDTRAGTSSFSGGASQGGRVTSVFTPGE